MEGYPVERDFDSFWKLSVVPDMDGDFEHFEEIDDDFLSTISLDDPSQPVNKCCYGNGKVKQCPPGECTCAEDKAKAAVNVPEKFDFPFEPYDIQVGFMQQLYRTMELGKIGIFESPTGTGKSLSLICGALTWLRHFENQQRQELELLLKEKAANDFPLFAIKKEKRDPDWITAFARKQEDEEKAKKLKEEQSLRLKQETRLHQLRNQLQPRVKIKRKRDRLEEQFEELYKDVPKEVKDAWSLDSENTETDKDELDDEFLIPEYHSDGEMTKGESSSESGDEGEDDHITKIYFCSRTHSQLAQFVREIQKSPFGEETRVVSLGSRQNMCINDSVRRLKSISLVNDRCLELQRNKSSKKTTDSGTKRKKLTGGCPFYKQDPMLDLRDRTLVEVRDIEQLVTIGRQMKACPYYGTRYAIPGAQLVALPYQTLLHRSTREACGIKLKGNIVIVDEAHNLADTISNVHRVEVTGAQLTVAYSQLTQYLERYRNRLKAKNLMYIRQILFVLSCFIKHLGGRTGVPADTQQFTKTGTRLQTINDFLFETHMDNLNLFKVTKYCQRSLISRKLHGFVEKYQPTVLNTDAEKKKSAEEQLPNYALTKFLKDISQTKGKVGRPSAIREQSKVETEEPQAVVSSPMMNIEGFLQALTNADRDGRIVVCKQELLSKSSIKFLLLNPAVHFTDVVSEARAVIVAGGTMQPLSEFKDQLFYAAGVEPERILEFSCGHVIPPENLLPIALARGSSGVELDFTYQSRDTQQMMDELGRVLYNVCNLVPGGVVCFFPSYEYERVVHEHWQKNGFLKKMAAKKKIFREPKSANMVDHVLGEYTACVNKHVSHRYVQYNGAILFCVVGGKMSEGINFSDDLGRCIVMVGLPYPNIRSPELKEKMDYLNMHMPKVADGKQPGQVHYENLCMKAVNQSIGRAIRHKGDYATILLLDYRYLRPAMKTKLPSWIGDSLQAIDRFGPAFSAIRQFFAKKAALR